MSDRKENGSITVEAALFIPMFLFAFMCIFSLISCVRAQVLIQYSVDQAAKEVAEYSYILEKTGVLDAYKGLNTKSEEFSKQMEDIKSNLEVIENTAKSVTNGQGTIQDVLVESVNDHDSSLVTGRMSNNLLVHFPGDESLIGKIVDVWLEESKGFYYMGKQVEGQES